MQAIFTVSGTPEGKARPRVTTRGTYTPHKTAAYEKLVQMSFRTQCPGVFFGDAPLCVYITANFAPPQSATKRKRSRMLSGGSGRQKSRTLTTSQKQCATRSTVWHTGTTRRSAA